jgi:hypothetical protein
MTIEDWEVDLRCSFDDSEIFERLGQKLDNCMVDYDKNEIQISEILKAYEIFDKYYTHNNKLSKENFDSYVNAVIGLNNNVIHHSDWAKEHRSGEVYILDAKRETYSMLKDAVNKYIKELRLECNDAYKYDI